MKNYLKFRIKKDKKPGHTKESSTSDEGDKNSSPTPEISDESEPITCPNENCGKIILEPLKMIDLSAKSEKTSFACPYCMSKLDRDREEKESPSKRVSIEETVSVKDAGANKKVVSKCPHHFGYLRERPKNAPIPDECITCSETIKCLLGNI